VLSREGAVSAAVQARFVSPGDVIVPSGVVPGLHYEVTVVSTDIRALVEPGVSLYEIVVEGGGERGLIAVPGATYLRIK
jgi:hypothetical protein